MITKNNIAPKLSRDIKRFIHYISLEKGLSNNTKASYSHDLKKFAEFLSNNNISQFSAATASDISLFLKLLDQFGLSPLSRSRYLSSIRGLFKYLTANASIDKDISLNIDLPKSEKKLPDTLDINDIDDILNSVNISKPAGIRDRAILETLYACGLRVSELCNLKQRDIMPDAEIIRVLGKGSKERFVPIDKMP